MICVILVHNGAFRVGLCRRCCFLSPGMVANSVGVCELGYVYCMSDTYAVLQIRILYVRYVLMLVVITYMADVGVLVF